MSDISDSDLETIKMIYKVLQLEFQMRHTALWQYDCVKCFKNMRIHQNQKTRSLISKNFENFEQSDSKLESNCHLPKMVKNGRFLTKNEFQRPRLVSFWSQKACNFCGGDRFSSMEIVS